LETRIAAVEEENKKLRKQTRELQLWREEVSGVLHDMAHREASAGPAEAETEEGDINLCYHNTDPIMKAQQPCKQGEVKPNKLPCSQLINIADLVGHACCGPICTPNGCGREYEFMWTQNNIIPEGILCQRSVCAGCKDAYYPEQLCSITRKAQNQVNCTVCQKVMAKRTAVRYGTCPDCAGASGDTRETHTKQYIKRLMAPLLQNPSHFLGAESLVIQGIDAQEVNFHGYKIDVLLTLTFPLIPPNTSKSKALIAIEVDKNMHDGNKPDDEKSRLKAELQYLHQQLPTLRDRAMLIRFCPQGNHTMSPPLETAPDGLPEIDTPDIIRHLIMRDWILALFRTPQCFPQISLMYMFYPVDHKHVLLERDLPAGGDAVRPAFVGVTSRAPKCSDSVYNNLQQKYAKWWYLTLTPVQLHAYESRDDLKPFLARDARVEWKDPFPRRPQLYLAGVKLPKLI
jgi:hypothetical protein